MRLSEEIDCNIDNELKNCLLNIYNDLSKKDKILIRKKLEEVDEDIDEKLIICHLIRQHYFNEDFLFSNPKNYYAINSSGERLYLVKFIGISDDQYIFSCYDAERENISESFIRKLRNDKNFLSSNRCKIIKFRLDDKMDNEFEGWNIFKSNNLPHPNVRLDYTFWKYRCLVMDPLEKISYDDRKTYIKVGVDMLDILSVFHNFGCHSDIKPDNIMKKNNHYYLIDMGGITTNRLEYGFRRKIWSPNYTCQERKSGVITTAKHDLIELAYTLNIIYRRCHNITCKKKDYRKMVEKTKVSLFYRYITKIDKENISPQIYEDLKRILLF